MQSLEKVNVINAEELSGVTANARRFADYWDSLPKLDLVPDSSAFDPAHQKSNLSSFVILEVVSIDIIRFRLAGTAEVGRYGREVTGRNYLDFVAADRRPQASLALRHMAMRPCGMLAIIHSISESGRTFANEALGFPMRGKGGNANLLYFQSNTMPVEDYYDARDDMIVSHDRIAKRRFIDIGAGVPEDFTE